MIGPSSIRGRLLLSFATLVLAGTPTHAQPGALASESFGAPAHERVLLDPDSDEASRRRAARGLAQLAATNHGAAETAARILRGNPPATARDQLIDALGRTTAPNHPRITGALGDLLDPEDEPLCRRTLAALGVAHTRAAVGPVMDLLEGLRGPLSPSLRRVAIETLTRQTGLEILGEDEQRWVEWWRTAQLLPEAEWRADLARAQSRRADALQRELDRAVGQMVELHRRLHLLSPEEDRPSLLAGLIASQETTLRELGLQLTERRLLNARPIGPVIIDAVAGALADPDASIRAQAASILGRLGTPETMQQVLAALLKENDDDAAAALLRAAGRQPQPALLPPALRWLEEGHASRSAASETLGGIVQSGVSLTANQSERARAVLESIDQDELTEADMALLVHLDRLPVVIDCLRGTSTSGAAAASRVIVRLGVAIDELVRVAHLQPEMIQPALDALSRHRRSIDGLREALELADPDDPNHRARLMELSRTIGHAELIQVAEREPRLVQRELLLAPAGEEAFFDSTPDPILQVRMAMALARTRVRLGDLSGARQGLINMPRAWRGPLIQQIEIEMLLTERRFDDAATLTISSARSLGETSTFTLPWFQLLHSRRDPAALESISRLQSELLGLLSADENLRLAALSGTGAGGEATDPEAAIDDAEQEPPRVDVGTSPRSHNR